MEINVAISDGKIDRAMILQLIEDFNDLHERLYTFADRAAAVELVNFRITAIGTMDKVSLSEVEQSDSKPEICASRLVHFGGDDFEQTSVYRREKLLASQRITGPAIIDQLDTTTVLFPGQGAVVDGYGCLVITEF